MSQNLRTIEPPRLIGLWSSVETATHLTSCSSSASLVRLDSDPDRDELQADKPRPDLCAPPERRVTRRARVSSPPERRVTSRQREMGQGREPGVTGAAAIGPPSAVVERRSVRSPHLCRTLSSYWGMITDLVEFGDVQAHVAGLTDDELRQEVLESMMIMRRCAAPCGRRWAGPKPIVVGDATGPVL
jgi:hypothetical protein